MFAARQEDPGEVQPLLGRGEQEQAGGGGVVHGPPHLTAHRHPGLLLHPSLNDGVSLSVCCCLPDIVNISLGHTRKPQHYSTFILNLSYNLEYYLSNKLVVPLAQLSNNDTK